MKNKELRIWIADNIKGGLPERVLGYIEFLEDLNERKDLLIKGMRQASEMNDAIYFALRAQYMTMAPAEEQREMAEYFEEFGHLNP